MGPGNQLSRREERESSNNVCQRMNNERPVKDAELELILSPGAVGDTPHSTLPATASAATSKKDKSGRMIRPALLSPDMKIFILIINSENIKRHRFSSAIGEEEYFQN